MPVSSDLVSFGPFVLDPLAFRLTRDGSPVPLQPKSLELLLMSVAGGGELVPRERITERLWPDVIVTEHSLRQQVRKVRDALEPYGSWLETVPRRGVRFVGPVARAAAGSVGTTVPAERDPFVGRAADLARLDAAVDEARLVTVLGPGGIGKTRLVVHRSSARGDDAVFCDLAATTDAHGVVACVARALGVVLGADDPVEQVAHALGRRSLVILDNFEQVVAHAEATVGRWLERSPSARFVVTSRHRLAVVGERVVALEPLEHDDAVALFRARARTVSEDGLADDAEAIGPLVAALDRLPLAIELAAARCAVLTPRAILGRLVDRFSLLTGGVRVARHATLTAVLDWSWELSAPADQAALAALSVFEGGFAVDAAEAVIGGAGALDRLHHLVDQSLVWRRSAVRFELSTTVREYAAHKLAEGGVDLTRAAEVRHGAWYGEHPEHADLVDLVAACRRALARADAPIAAATAIASARVYTTRGPMGAAAELVERALELPGAPEVHLRVAAASAHLGSSRFDAAEAHLRRAAAIDGVEPHVADEIGLAFAQLARGRGQLDQARAGLLERLPAARGRGDRPLVLGILRQLAVVDQEASRLPDALRWGEEALDAVRALDDPRTEAWILANLGIVLMELGRLDRAGECYEAALAINVAVGARNAEGAVLTNLGILRGKQGDHAQSLALAERALAAQQAVGDRRAEAGALGNLGNSYAWLGRTREAVAHHQAAVELYRALGVRWREALFLGNLGWMAVLQGRLEEAEQFGHAALAAAPEGHGGRGTASMVLGLVDEQLHGDLERARVRLGEALEVYRASGAVFGQAQSSAALARVGGDLGLADAAVALAASIPAMFAEVSCERALLRARAGRFDEAVQDLAPALAFDPSAVLSRGTWLPVVALVRALAGDRAGAAEALGEAAVLAEALEFGPRSRSVRLAREAAERLVLGRRPAELR